MLPLLGRLTKTLSPRSCIWYWSDLKSRGVFLAMFPGLKFQKSPSRATSWFKWRCQSVLSHKYSNPFLDTRGIVRCGIQKHAYIYIYIHAYIYIYIYIYVCIFPVLVSATRPFPPTPMVSSPPPLARPGPNMPNPCDCACFSHMAAPKPSTVTRISSQTHPILVTINGHFPTRTLP